MIPMATPNNSPQLWTLGVIQTFPTDCALSLKAAGRRTRYSVRMINLRRASPTDAPAMARVIVDTWFATHRQQVSAQVLQKRQDEWGYAESEQGWRRTIRDADGTSAQVLVATDEDRIVAIAASEVTGADCAELGALYVDVGHQRSGIGRRLLQAALDHYRNAGISTLHVAVLAENLTARQFYESLGGRFSGAREHEDGPEVVYTWDLVEETAI
jgi:ribosomal protein S18 acetylase RimI-like enzyme